MTTHVDQVSHAERNLPVDVVIPVVEQNRSRCHIYNAEFYEKMYKQSIQDPDRFWAEQARDKLRWISEFTKVCEGGFEHGDISWFVNGKLNACDVCVDRWAEKTPDQIALIWEGDEPGNVKKITYAELLRNVCKCANMLKRLGVRKYDSVCVYMPMIPETLYVMLACARLGAVHSLVFAGFSAPNLRDRILDAHSRVVVTCDQGIRGGKVIPLKAVVDEALRECPDVKSCVVFKHLGHPVKWEEGRDWNGTDLMENCRPYCPIEVMDSEDNLFMLYTSGSTGKPKGIAHSTAGYLLYAAMTFQYVFDYHPGDVYACVADVGWITGHTYIVYGPLCCGSSTFMFESVPTYPDSGRYWDMVQRHKITQFYTAPTALRALMRAGDELPKQYDLSSLRVLGSVGEPINPEAWKWYFDVIGNKRCSIVDTYWQTETGGHLISPLPGASPMKPGCAGKPFFGIDPVIVDPATGKILEGNSVSGVLCIRSPWPGVMRTVYGDHERMLNVYLKPYPGLYFTGDGAVKDKDGYIWVTGRVDDTINVSGHRIGSAEVEHALVQHPGVSEAAVVGYPHPIKGSGLFCYVTLKDSLYEMTDYSENDVKAQLRDCVRREIGAIASPDHILITPHLPKTRSGKIMRRLLRKIATLELDNLGDTTTLADPIVVDILVDKVKSLLISVAAK